MKFVLNEYKAELTDEIILQDIKKVANTLNVDFIPISIYKKNELYPQSAIKRHLKHGKRLILSRAKNGAKYC